MSEAEARRMHGERGASLILAIAFMVVIGAITAAVLATTSSGIQDRVTLDQARNREYNADGAIETMIAAARGLGGACPSSAAFPPLTGSEKIHIDCGLAPSAVVDPGGVLQLQNNLAFYACPFVGTGSGSPCTPATTIINAQVNFQGPSPSTTFVQAWSVNR